MKRDYTTIKKRIEDLGLTSEHVAKQFKIHVTTFSKIIKGDPKRVKAAIIESIHTYLDKVKTRIGKDFK